MQAVLWQARGAWLTFKQAAILKANEAPTPIDGDVVVHRSEIAFLQVLP